MFVSSGFDGCCYSGSVIVGIAFYRFPVDRSVNASALVFARGLCNNRSNSFGMDDPEFLKKWENILNKCLLDLEVLMIEKTKEDREKKTSIH